MRVTLATQIAAMTVDSAWRVHGVTAFTHTKAAISREVEAYRHLVFLVEPQRTTFGDGRATAGDFCVTRYIVTMFYVARFGVDGLGEWADVDAANNVAEHVASHIADTDDFSVELVGLQVSQPNENGVIAIQIEVNLQHAFSG